MVGAQSLFWASDIWGIFLRSLIRRDLNSPSIRFKKDIDFGSPIKGRPSNIPLRWQIVLSFLYASGRS